MAYLSLLEICKRKISNIVHTSLSSVYGKQNKPIRKSKIDTPLTVYSATKITGSTNCLLKLFSMNFIGLRFFTVLAMGKADMVQIFL